MAGGKDGTKFEDTPSWVVGAVVLGMVVISLVIEKLLHYLGHILKKKDKIPLYLALQKIKEELMLLGFISLLLTVSQDTIDKWCMPEKFALYWLPCHHTDKIKAALSLSSGGSRRLLAAGDSKPTSCPKGKVSFVSGAVVHEVHYLIFVLAITHVLSCALIVFLGEMKILQWRKWEEAIIRQYDEDFDRNDRIIDVRSLSFIKNRFDGNDAKYRNYVKSFFKHLAGIFTKADYKAMRTGFILTHCNGNVRFNFHKYIVYAYEADFNRIVSISWFMWLIVVITLTLNVAGWHIYFALSFIPLILLLVLGTKLEQVITDLAIYIAQRHTVVFGELKIQPSDEHFWWNKPKIFLVFIHIILFVNSIGSAIYFWALWKYGSESCVMDKPLFTFSRLVIMFVVQIICSYSTLPLYAIVTQMGSSYNKEAMERFGSGLSRPNSNADGTMRTEVSVEMGNHHQERH